MSEERIDIVLTDQVSEEPTRKIKLLGDTARATHDVLKQMKEMLGAINSSALRKLQEDTTASVTAITRQETAIQRLEAAQARTATATARLEAAQAKTTTATIEGAIASQRLATEQERTARTTLTVALAKEKLETATRRNTQATERDGDAAVKLYQQNEKLIEQANRAQVKAASLNASGSFSTVSSGALHLVPNAENDMTMPSKALYEADARAKLEAARATQALERSTIALKSASDPLFAAQQQYNRTMAEANKLLAAGALNQTEHARISTMAAQGLQQAEHATARFTDATKLSRFQVLTLQYTINDIAASLASGASPFTILMQQGGQVTQAWGGLMPTLRAAGAMLMSVTGLVTMGAAAVGLFVYAYDQAGAAGRAYTKVLIESGDASGKTTTNLLAMTGAVAAAGEVSRSSAQASISAFVAAGSVAGDSIERFSTTAVRMQREMGIAVKDTVAEFTKLKDDPVAASEKLNKATHYLTLSTYDQIRALVDRGDKEAAGALAQKTYADAMDDRTARLSKNLGLIETAWRGVQKAAVWAWDTMLGVGRAEDPTEAIKKQINVLEGKLRNKDSGVIESGDNLGFMGKRYAAQLTALQAQLVLQEKGNGYEALGAVYAKQSADLVAAKVEWNKQGLEVESKTAKQTREINEARVIGNKLLAEGNITQKQLDDRLDFIRAKYKEPAGPKDKSNGFSGDQEAAKEWAAAVLEADNLTNKANGKIQELTQAEIAYNKHLGDTATTLTGRISPAMRDMLADKLAAAAAAEKQAKAEAEVEKVMKTLLVGANKETAAIEERLKKQLEANAQMGMTKAQILEEKAAREELAAQADEDYAQALRIASVYAGEYKSAYIQYAAALEQAAKNRRDLSKAEAAGGIKQAAVTAAAEAEKAWERADKKIEDGLYEAISNGGEAAIKKLIKDAKEWFARLVLSPIIKPIADFGASLLNPTAKSAGGNAGSTASSVLTKLGVPTGVMDTLGSIGKMVGTWAPYVAAAAVVKDLMSYKIDPKGNGITATLGANGLPTGKVGAFSEFQQTGGIGGGGVTTNRTWSEADGGTAAYVNASLQNTTAMNKAYAISLGLNADALNSYTKSIEINTTGMDAAAVQAAIDAEIIKFSNEQIAAAYGDTLAAVTRNGESSTDTLTRISTELAVVNSTFTALGYTLFDLSVAGGAAASGLVAAMGGLEAFQSQMNSYYSNYLPKEEQRQKALEGFSTTLADVGINYSTAQLGAANKGEIRSAVDALAGDTGTAEGAKRYAAAVKVANALAALPPVVDDTTTAAKTATASLGGSGGGGGLSGAAAKAADALSNLTQSLYDEVERIRQAGQASTGTVGYAEAQMQFAVATAQARAHDEEAIKALPALSQNMLRLAEANERSLTDLNFVRGTTMASLQLTAAMNGGMPSFAVGTDYVPRDMIARIHKGEKITPAAYNSGGGDAETNAILNAIYTKIETMTDDIKDIRASSAKTRDITEKSDTIGPAPARATL